MSRPTRAPQDPHKTPAALLARLAVIDPFDKSEPSFNKNNFQHNIPSQSKITCMNKCQ